MTRYPYHTAGRDGAPFYEYVCDCCGDTVHTEAEASLPDRWLTVGLKKATAHHVCPSCRYAGAVDLVTRVRVRTIHEQLGQTAATASKILTFMDTDPKLRHAARMVIIDISLCVEQLKKVNAALEELA